MDFLELFSLAGRVVINRQEAIQDLKAIDAEGRRLAGSLGQSFTHGGSQSARGFSVLTGQLGQVLDLLGKIAQQGSKPIPTPKPDPKATDEFKKQIQEIKNQAASLRNIYQFDGNSAQAIKGLEALRLKTLEVFEALKAEGKTSTAEFRNVTLALAQIERTMTGIQGGVTRLGVGEQVARALGKSYNDLKAELVDLTREVTRNTTVSGENRARLEAIRDAALKAASGLDNTSKEFAQLRSVAATANETLDKVDRRAQGVTGSFGELLAILGGNQLIRSIGGMVSEAAQAELQMGRLERATQNAGQAASGIDGVMGRLSKTFKVSEADLAGPVATLINLGATSEQTYQLLLRAGASARNYGRSFADGFDNIATALASGSSIALQGIGIAANFGKEYTAVGEKLKDASDAVRGQAQAQVLLNAISRETEADIRDLGGFFEGYTGKVQESTQAVAVARREIGQAAMPVYAQFLGLVAKLARGFTDLPKPIQDSTVALAGLAGLTLAGSGLLLFLNNVRIALIAIPALASLSASSIAVAFGVGGVAFMAVVALASKINEIFKQIDEANKKADQLSSFNAVRGLPAKDNALIEVIGEQKSALAKLREEQQKLLKLQQDLQKAGSDLNAVQKANLARLNQQITATEQRISRLQATVQKDLQARKGASSATSNPVDDAAFTKLANQYLRIQRLEQEFENASKAGDFAKAQRIQQRIAQVDKEIKAYIDKAKIEKDTADAAERAAQQAFQTGEKQIKSAEKAATTYQKVLASFAGGQGFSESQDAGANKGLHGYSKYGHDGADIVVAGGKGASVYNPFAGAKVLEAGPGQGANAAYGNMIRLLLQNGDQVILGHFQRVGVQAGEVLAKGALLGLQGNSGHVFSKVGDGTHLHIGYKLANGGIVYNQNQLEQLLAKAGAASGVAFSSGAKDTFIAGIEQLTTHLDTAKNKLTLAGGPSNKQALTAYKNEVASILQQLNAFEGQAFTPERQKALTDAQVKTKSILTDLASSQKELNQRLKDEVNAFAQRLKDGKVTANEVYSSTKAVAEIQRVATEKGIELDQKLLGSYRVRRDEAQKLYQQELKLLSTQEAFNGFVEKQKQAINKGADPTRMAANLEAAISRLEKQRVQVGKNTDAWKEYGDRIAKVNQLLGEIKPEAEARKLLGGKSAYSILDTNGPDGGEAKLRRLQGHFQELGLTGTKAYGEITDALSIYDGLAQEAAERLGQARTQSAEDAKKSEEDYKIALEASIKASEEAAQRLAQSYDFSIDENLSVQRKALDAGLVSLDDYKSLLTDTIGTYTQDLADVADQGSDEAIRLKLRIRDLQDELEKLGQIAVDVKQYLPDAYDFSVEDNLALSKEEFEAGVLSLEQYQFTLADTIGAYNQDLAAIEDQSSDAARKLRLRIKALLAELEKLKGAAYDAEAAARALAPDAYDFDITNTLEVRRQAFLAGLISQEQFQQSLEDTIGTLEGDYAAVTDKTTDDALRLQIQIAALKKELADLGKVAYETGEALAQSLADKLPSFDADLQSILDLGKLDLENGSLELEKYKELLQDTILALENDYVAARAKAAEGDAQAIKDTLALAAAIKKLKEEQDQLNHKAQKAQLETPDTRNRLTFKQAQENNETRGHQPPQPTFLERLLTALPTILQGLDKLGGLVASNLKDKDPRKEQVIKGQSLVNAAMQAASGDWLGAILSILSQFSGALEPLIPWFQYLGQLLEALRPIIEVILQLLGAALTPALTFLSWLVTNIVAPAFRFVAQLIGSIWNAIASAVNNTLGWLGVHLPTIDGPTSSTLTPPATGTAFGGPSTTSRILAASAPQVSNPLSGISMIESSDLQAQAANVMSAAADRFAKGVDAFNKKAAPSLNTALRGS